MAEKISDAKVVLVNYICDECGEGVMRRVGDIMFMSNPPKFYHECTNCGVGVYFDRYYPYERFEPIGE